MIDLAEARAHVLARVVPLPAAMVPVSAADGCVVAAPVVAGEAVPPFANSAVDGFAAREIVTFSSSTTVSSTITTASAPSGIGAPVMIRIAWPSPTCRPAGSAPAGSVATTASVTGADATSDARTANPSTAVLANGGTASSAVTVTDVAQPSASASGTARGCSGRHEARISLRASSSGITPASCAGPGRRGTR